MKMITSGVLLICAFSLWTLPVDSARNINGRIIGGEIARAGQFPYAAAIEIRTSNARYFCGGTIIDNNWILTSAQCVDDGVLFDISVGTNGLNSDDATKLSTDNYFLHPDYNPLTLENDIGLIKLRLPIQFTDYINRVNFLADSPLPAGSSVVSIGWGQTSDTEGGLAEELNYVYVTSLSITECQQTFGQQITENMVCIDGNFNQGTCIGDTGGPLIQYGSRGVTYHVGIASFLSGNGCESTDPSGYTRTSPYRNWIQEVMFNN